MLPINLRARVMRSRIRACSSVPVRADSASTNKLLDPIGPRPRSQDLQQFFPAVASRLSRTLLGLQSLLFFLSSSHFCR